MSAVLFEDPHIALSSPSPQEVFRDSLTTTVTPTLPSTKLPGKHGNIKTLIVIYAALFLTPITGAYALTFTGLAPKAQGVALVSPVSSNEGSPNSSTTPINQVAQAPRDYEYELSLAQNFLQKAVTLSNAEGEQTSQQKTQIVAYLNQALEAANRATTITPTDPRGYSTRSKVYQALAVIKPEMKAFADQDLAQAQSLETSQNLAVAPQTTQVPATEQTSQHYTVNGGIIAAPSQDQQQPISTTTESNANRGTTTLQANTKEVFVSYPTIKDSTQLYVTADKNPGNLTLYVKNKEAGSGFTIASTAAPTSPLEITWWEIE